MARIIACRPTTGTERLLKVEQQNGRWDVATLRKPMPDLPRDCTHIISGTKPFADGVFTWLFVIGYSARTGATHVFVWGGPIGDYRWLQARVASTTNLISPLPVGITAMTVLSVGNHSYLAFLVDRRLEIHDIGVGQPAWDESLIFSLDERSVFGAWMPQGEVQLASLSEGAYRRTLVGYHVASGVTAVDRVSIAGDNIPYIARGATLERQDSVLWPARSLVRAVDARVLRYGPDGMTEVWTFQ
jgi:hypothetical protein